MLIKDIKTISVFSKDFPDHILVLNIFTNKFSIINTTAEVPFGYYKRKIYKGISEDGYISKMGLAWSLEVKQEVYPINTYIQFNKNKLNEVNIDYLEDKRNKIYVKINAKSNFRTLMAIKI